MIIFLKIEDETKNLKKIKHDAWVGDRKGHEFLLKNPKMKNLTKLISEKVRLYIEMLNIENEKIFLFLQRSWATITRKEERILPHSHDQSNISFAYYPLKPEKSGDICFVAQSHQNEIVNGLFHQDALELGILKGINQKNARTIDIDIKEDGIVIFPSKTKHSTQPNIIDNPRISISGDISIVLKKSFGYEKFLPHFDNWQSL